MITSLTFINLVVTTQCCTSMVCAVKKFSCEKWFSSKCTCHICGLHVVTVAYGSSSCIAVNPCGHLEFVNILHFKVAQNFEVWFPSDLTLNIKEIFSYAE
jgi:hypothetical protein